MRKSGRDVAREVQEREAERRACFEKAEQQAKRRKAAAKAAAAQAVKTPALSELEIKTRAELFRDIGFVIHRDSDHPKYGKLAYERAVKERMDARRTTPEINVAQPESTHLH